MNNSRWAYRLCIVMFLAAGSATAYGVPRVRDIVLCATAAEETRGGGVGVDWMIENHWQALGPPEAVWNEGGGSTQAPAAHSTMSSPRMGPW